MTFNQYLFFAYCAMIVLCSLIAFVLYCNDKKKAIKGEIRTKEKTLLFFGVFFGALGSFIGRKVAHHKTDKKYFSAVIYFGLLLQAITLVFTFFLAYIA